MPALSFSLGRLDRWGTRTPPPWTDRRVLIIARTNPLPGRHETALHRMPLTAPHSQIRPGKTAADHTPSKPLFVAPSCKRVPMRVEQVMHPSPETLTPDHSREHALAVHKRTGVNCVPILGEETPVEDHNPDRVFYTLTAGPGDVFRLRREYLEITNSQSFLTLLDMLLNLGGDPFKDCGYDFYLFLREFQPQG